MRAVAVRVLCGSLVLAALAACSDNAGPAPIPAGIVIAPGDTTLQEGKTIRFYATFVDTAGHQVIGTRPVSWWTDDTTIVTISSSGVARARQEGTTRVWAGVDTMGSFVTLLVIDSAITMRLMLPGSPFGIAVSGSKSYVTLSQRDSMAVLSVPSESQTGMFSTGATPTSVDFNPAGTRAFVSNQGSHSVGSINVANNAVSGASNAPNSPLAVLTSADGSTVWVTSGSVDLVYAINTTTLLLTDSAATPRIPNGLARHPTLPRLYVSGSEDGRVFELDANTLDSLRAWALGGSAQGMMVSADGSRLYVANEDGWVDEITLATGAIATSLPIAGGLYGYGPFGLALSPNGTIIAVSTGVGAIHFLDAGTLAILRTVQTGGVPRRISFRSDGARLLVANEAGWVDFIR